MENKSKNMKIRDQSKSSYLKFPGISEKENRETREIYREKCKKNSQNLRTRFHIKGLTMRSGPFITLGTMTILKTFGSRGLIILLNSSMRT